MAASKPEDARSFMVERRASPDFIQRSATTICNRGRQINNLEAGADPLQMRAQGIRGVVEAGCLL